MFVLENVTDPQTPTEYSDVPMDGGVAETLGATLPQASSPPAEGAAGAALRLDDALAAQLERTVRSMHPEYALVNVKRDIARKSDRVYVIHVHGAGEHFCLNKGAAHSRSRVYFTVTPKGVAQKCFSRGQPGSEGSCECFRSRRVRLPPDLQAALFGEAVVGACRERERGTEQRAAQDTSLVPAYQDTTYHAPSPPPEVPPTSEAKRKRSVGTSVAPRAKLQKFAPPALGANGRPIVLANVKYSVDLAALKEYAATDEAGRTKASHDVKEHRSALTEREVLQHFFRHVVPTASGDGLCTVSYTRSEVGQALVEAGLLRQARLYPDTYWSCATQLGHKLRNMALGKFYVEMDDKAAFHKLLQARTQCSEAKALIERILSDPTLLEELSQHYFEVPDRTEDIKTLLHRVSNGGSADEWQTEKKLARPNHAYIVSLCKAMSQVTLELATTGSGPAAIQLITERFPNKKKRLPNPADPMKMKEVQVPRDPARCWKSYLLQCDEACGLLAKMQAAARERFSTGPPLHDCLIVAKTHDEEIVASIMSEAVASATGVNVVVRPKSVPPHITDRAFHLNFDTARFREAEFVSNAHLCSQEEVDRSLEEYNRWLRRFFVSVTDEIHPLVAQVYYQQDSDQVQQVICRTPVDTRAIYLDMDIVTKVAMGKKDPTMQPLLLWYLRSNPARHTKEHVNMWTNPTDIANHSNDLNIFGGLDFDERFRNDPAKPAPAPFEDPFPSTGALPRCAAGLSGSAQPSVLAPDAEWRTLEGLRFILWHLKYILCGGHEAAFAYVMQWFGFNLQVRLKPGVMLQFVSEEGIGKSAIFGRNRSGPGILMRIYGRYYQWSDDVESLLGKFNGHSMDRLFCVMEEAGTYRKGHKDHNKMKSMITEGIMTVELKHINATTKNDHRAFAMLTNNRDSLKITDGARRFLCLEGNAELSQKAVDENRCDADTRHEYMAKLDRVKNDDEVAYAFFKFCMLLDLSSFRVDAPPRTELFEEQRSHNECALKRFLLDVRSGAYPLYRRPGETWSGRLEGHCLFTALELFGRLKVYMAETGAQTTVDSVMALGHAISKNYATLAPKVEGRVARYRLQVAAGGDD